MSTRHLAAYLPGAATAAPPWLVATTDQELSEQGYGLGLPFQRQVFTAEGRDWVFYAHGYGEFADVDLLVTSSTDGASWETPAVVRTLPGLPNGSSYMSLHFDGADVHVLIGGDDEIDLLYRRGTPQSDGSIAWLEDEQVVFSGLDLRECSIATDSAGRVWAAWEHFNGAQSGYPRPMASRSDETDGTWETASGFPVRLSDESFYSWVGIVRAGDAGEMMALWLDDALFTVFARFWDGSAWGEPHAIPDGGASRALWSYASDPGTGRVFVAASNILHVWDGVSWAGEEISDSEEGPDSIALSWDPDDDRLHAVWVTWDNLIRHAARSPAGAWSTPVTLVDGAADHAEQTIIANSLQASEQLVGGRGLVAYQVAVSGDDDELYALPLLFEESGEDIRNVAGAIVLVLGATGAVAKTAGATGAISLGLAVGDDASKTGSTAGTMGLSTDLDGDVQKIAEALGEVAIELGLTGEVTVLEELDTEGTIGLTLAAHGDAVKIGTTSGDITLNMLIEAVAAKSAEAAGALVLALGIGATAEKVSTTVGSIGLELGLTGDVSAIGAGDVEGQIALVLGLLAVASKQANAQAVLALALDLEGEVEKAGSAVGSLGLALGLTGAVDKEAGTAGTIDLTTGLGGTAAKEVDVEGAIGLLLTLIGSVGEFDAGPVKLPTSADIQAWATNVTIAPNLLTAEFLSHIVVALIESSNAKLVVVDSNLGVVEIQQNPKTVVVSPNVLTVGVNE